MKSDNLLHNNEGKEFLVIDGERILKGAIIDYETIPHRVKAVLDNSYVEIEPIGHEWETEIILLSHADPIEITEPFLKTNGFKKNKEGLFEYSGNDTTLAYDLENHTLFIIVNSFMLPKPVEYIHDLQLQFAAIGIKHEFIFKKQFYKSNL